MAFPALEMMATNCSSSTRLNEWSLKDTSKRTTRAPSLWRSRASSADTGRGHGQRPTRSVDASSTAMGTIRSFTSRAGCPFARRS
jgi:hypothetical protein